MNAVIVSPDIEQIKREAVIRAYNEFSGAIPLMAAGGRNHFAPRYGTDGQRLSAMGFNPIRKRMIMIEPADLDDYWNLSMFDMERGISSSFKRPISTKGVDEFIDLREFALEFSPSRPATHEPETHVAPEPDDDSDFYTCVSKETIRDQVVKRIRKFKVKPESQISPDNQIVMPGFERVQVAYVIDADGEQIAVPLVKMTSAQRRAKVTELRAMGAGCYQHADELERYESLYPAAA